MYKNKLSKNFLTVALTTSVILGFCYQAQAAGLVPENTSDLNSFLVLAINISQYILGIVGSLTLLMFVIGGVQFMISAGSPESVSKAKKTIVAAVVGLLIVFSSWLIINFVMQSLEISASDSPGWNWSVLK